MAGINFTTDEIINQVKDIVTVPTSQGLFLPANFIRLMNLELHKKLVPAIKRVNEEYFVTTQDAALVANQSRYRLPTRAVSGVLRDIQYLDTGGKPIEFPRLEPEYLKSSPIVAGDKYWGYYFQGSHVVVVPTPANVNGESIRFIYERRPNNFVLASAAGTITAIDTGTKEVTVSSVPSTWTTSTIFDIIRPNPLFDSVGDDQTINTIASNVLTFDSLPADMAVGQWVVEAGFSPVPNQLPYEGALVLAELAAAKALQSIKDAPGLKAAITQAKDDLEFLINDLTPRNPGTPQKAVSRSGIFDYIRPGSRRFI